MELNHCAFLVSKVAFDFVISLFAEKLGFRVLRRVSSIVWLRQGEISVDIQLSASNTKPETLKYDKPRSQIAFLSEQPEKDLRRLADWIENNGYKTVVRSYSDKEFFLDIPEVFVDFVIEAMTPECAQYDT